MVSSVSAFHDNNSPLNNRLKKINYFFYLLIHFFIKLFFFGANIDRGTTIFFFEKEKLFLKDPFIFILDYVFSMVTLFITRGFSKNRDEKVVQIQNNNFYLNFEKKNNQQSTPIILYGLLSI